MEENGGCTLWVCGKDVWQRRETVGLALKMRREELRMRWKKCAAALLGVACLAGSFAGCGKGDGADNGMEPVKGRYVEAEIPLPDGLEGLKVSQIFMDGGKVHLLASGNDNGKNVFQEWELGEDGFAEVTPGWMAAMALPVSGEWTEQKLLLSGEGKRSLYTGYVAEGEEDFKAHLWTEEGGAAKEITPEKWTRQNEEWGGYEMLMGIAALDDGTVAAVSYTSADILDGKTGAVLESGGVSAQYENVVSDGENIWLCWAHSEGVGLTLEKRRGGKADEAEAVSFSWGGGQMQLCPMKDGTLLLAGEEGLFRGTPVSGGKTDVPGGSEEQAGAQGGVSEDRFLLGTEDGIVWEKLLAGAESDFGLSDRWCTGLAATAEGAVYALFEKSGGGSLLKRYEYDPEAIIEVKENLKLYAVHESGLLSQAAALYHRKYPEVMIEIEYVYPRYYDGETDYNDVYQKLNTMLMGEQAPDILVLDSLDVDSYAEKGLLADINDVVGAMEESGELLSNITSSYLREDGHRYVVPLEFAFNMAMGRDISARDMASVEGLAAFLAKEEYSYMGSLTAGELTDRFYPYFCEEIVDGKKLDTEALGGYLEALKAIGDNCGILEDRDKDSKAYNMWMLASEAKLAFERTEGFNDAMFPLAIVDYIQGDFTAFENCYIPMVQMGICSKSSYTDRAKDFLRFILSEEIQEQDSYGGFPVNVAALKKNAARDRSEAEAETEISADGGYVEFKVRQYSPETAQRLVELCKSLEKPAVEDEKIREVLAEALEGYLRGEQDTAGTVQKIEDGLKMYLAE